MRNIHIKNIKKGQIFKESDQEFVALEDAYISGALGKHSQYSVNGKHTVTGDVVDFMVTETLEHYGPKLTIE